MPPIIGNGIALSGVAAAVYLSIRQILKDMKTGGCAGCSGHCGGGCAGCASHCGTGGGCGKQKMQHPSQTPPAQP